VSPPFLYAQGRQTLALSAPNERNAPMTGFRATVPDGLRVLRADPESGWKSTVEGTTATWTGGASGPGDAPTFVLELAARAQPGPAELQAVQEYPDGSVVRWPVSLTIVPGDVSEAGQVDRWKILVFVGSLGLLVFGTIVFAARRRRRPLQET
jgi:uncharacterized protein YcnI